MVIWNYPQWNKLMLSIEFDCQICQGDCTPEILMEWLLIAILWGSSSATFHYTGSLIRILAIVYEIMIYEIMIYGTNPIGSKNQIIFLFPTWNPSIPKDPCMVYLSYPLRKSPLFIANTSSNGGFPIAMLVYRSVHSVDFSMVHGICISISICFCLISHRHHHWTWLSALSRRFKNLQCEIQGVQQRSNHSEYRFQVIQSALLIP